jgi:hypothetical protein
MEPDIDRIGSRSGADRGTNPDALSATATKAKEGAEQLKTKALERVEEARDKALSSKEKMAARVRRVGSAVRSASDNLRQEDDMVARYAEKASDRIERAAQYLSTTEPRQIMRDAEGFGRREPAVFFGGAFLLGLVVGRFLKSSQEHENALSFDEDFERRRLPAPRTGQPRAVSVPRDVFAAGESTGQPLEGERRADLSGGFSGEDPFGPAPEQKG